LYLISKFANRNCTLARHSHTRSRTLARHTALHFKQASGKDESDDESDVYTLRYEDAAIYAPEESTLSAHYAVFRTTAEPVVSAPVLSSHAYIDIDEEVPIAASVENATLEKVPKIFTASGKKERRTVNEMHIDMLMGRSETMSASEALCAHMPNTSSRHEMETALLPDIVTFSIQGDDGMFDVRPVVFSDVFKLVSFGPPIRRQSPAAIEAASGSTFFEPSPVQSKRRRGITESADAIESPVPVAVHRQDSEESMSLRAGARLRRAQSKSKAAETPLNAPVVEVPLQEPVVKVPLHVPVAAAPLPVPVAEAPVRIGGRGKSPDALKMLEIQRSLKEIKTQYEEGLEEHVAEIAAKYEADLENRVAAMQAQHEAKVAGILETVVVQMKEFMASTNAQISAHTSQLAALAPAFRSVRLAVENAEKLAMAITGAASTVNVSESKPQLKRKARVLSDDEDDDAVATRGTGTVISRDPKLMDSLMSVPSAATTRHEPKKLSEKEVEQLNVLCSEFTEEMFANFCVFIRRIAPTAYDSMIKEEELDFARLSAVAQTEASNWIRESYIAAKRTGRLKTSTLAAAPRPLVDLRGLAGDDDSSEDAPPPPPNWDALAKAKNADKSSALINAWNSHEKSVKAAEAARCAAEVSKLRECYEEENRRKKETEDEREKVRAQLNQNSGKVDMLADGILMAQYEQRLRQ
jgi:hypothetical protein